MSVLQTLLSSKSLERIPPLKEDTFGGLLGAGWRVRPAADYKKTRARLARGAGEISSVSFGCLCVPRQSRNCRENDGL